LVERLYCTLSPKDQQIRERILKELSVSHFKPLKEEEILKSTSEAPVLHFLVKTGDVVKLPSGDISRELQWKRQKRFCGLLKRARADHSWAFRDIAWRQPTGCISPTEYFDAVRVTKGLEIPGFWLKVRAVA